MGLSPGMRLGPYEIESALGAGGMGEVYRARDTRLDRTVAIKILNSSLTSSPDVRARFEREARVVSQLQHPHICVLHDIGRDAGIDFLVMEYLQGTTLADRIHSGPMPLVECLKVAIEIADALQKAHKAGIVHRDLKPGNVMLTKSGAKLLDFGLAKPIGAGAAAGAGNSSSQSVFAAAMTVTSPAVSPASPLSNAGMIVGTVQYMAPEQLQGVEADARSDIFAFGLMFFEMVTGKRAFQGKTQASLVGSILANDPPPVSSLQPGTPPSIDRFVRVCVSKDPDERFQCMHDVKLQLEAIADSGSQSLVGGTGGGSLPLWKLAISLAAVALVTGLIVAVAAWELRPRPTPPVVTRFTSQLPQGLEFFGTGRNVVAISPDGKFIAYTAGPPMMVYIRAMGELVAHGIRGSESASVSYGPVFSPDGRYVAYWSYRDGAIQRIAVDGGTPTTVCQTDIPFGMTWDGDEILFSNNAGIHRVPAAGGTPVKILSVGIGEVAFTPRLLPNGRGVLYTLASGAANGVEEGTIVVQPLSGGPPKTIIADASDARLLANGYLAFLRGGVLYAAQFDLDKLQLVGKEVPVVEGVKRGAGAMGINPGYFSVSDTGTLVYVPGPTNGGRLEDLTLILDDLSDNHQALGVIAGTYRRPRVSRDGRFVAFEATDNKVSNIWVWELAGKAAARRLTFTGNNHVPLWSSDNRHIAFQAEGDKGSGIFWQSADGTGVPEMLVAAAKGAVLQPVSWSPNGDGFLYDSTFGNDTTLWFYSLREHKSTQLPGIHSASLAVTGADFSPDGKWIAYAASGNANSTAIYVEPFPQNGTKYQISGSAEYGHHPFWSRDGKSLYYTPGPGTRLMKVPVTTGAAFSFGTPAPIELHFYNTAPGVQRSLDIMPDNKHILTLQEGMDTTGRSTQIDFVTNWFEELKRKAAAGGQ